jgi:hypothetical protein
MSKSKKDKKEWMYGQWLRIRLLMQLTGKVNARFNGRLLNGPFSTRLFCQTVKSSVLLSKYLCFQVFFFAWSIERIFISYSPG